MMFAVAALGVVNLIVLLATQKSVRSTLARQHPRWSDHQLTTTVHVIVAAGIVFGLVFLVLYVLLALQVRKGKNWARIVTFVLAGIGVLGLLASFARPAAGAGRVVSALSGLLDIGIIVLLTQPPSNVYFARRW
jgi:hypothetical protein